MKQMKLKVTLVGMLLIGMIIGCSKQDVFDQPIKDYVKTNALGVDLKYEGLSRNVTDTVLVKESLSRLVKIYSSSNITNIDSLISKLKWYVDNSDDKKDSPDEYEFNKNSLKHIIKLKQMNPDDVNYYVIKDKYTIINPLLNNTKVECNVTFLANANYVIVGKVNNDDLIKQKYAVELYFDNEVFINSNKLTK